ncbi:MAG TPA: site-specific integrase [Acidobacteriaceae bacterium]|nr:site-specific integrase [Acidobacteriaceae bacterium]
MQKIRVPDTGHLSWIVVDGEHLPVTVLNEYLLYLHRLRRSPNTVRAYAHHLQAFWAFLVEHGHDWQRLKLTQLAEFVSWVRHAKRTGRDHRSDATINLILAAIGSFYEHQDRLGWRLRSVARAAMERRVRTSRSCTTSAGHNPFAMRSFVFVRSSAYLACSRRSKFNLCWMRVHG